MGKQTKLPPLPEPWCDTPHGWAFTADQMRAYAGAERARGDAAVGLLRSVRQIYRNALNSEDFFTKLSRLMLKIDAATEGEVSK